MGRFVSGAQRSAADHRVSPGARPFSFLPLSLARRSRARLRRGRSYAPRILALGSLFGLLSAWGHTFAYLASRDFTAARAGVPARGNAFELLVMAHVPLGLVAAVALAVTWDASALAAACPALAFSFVCFFVAQASLFAALQRVEASTVAPLLSVKIATLALASWAVQGVPVTPLGAAAIALAIAGAAVVGGIGKRPDAASLGLILLAVSAYTGCDMGIVRGIEGMLGASAGEPDAAERLAAGMRCLGAMYTALGLVAAVLLPAVLRRPSARPRWPGALAYAGCWAAAMATLFSAFALLPVVLVAILQSTRSVWSVLLGGYLGRAGHAHLETSHSNGALAGRVAGAVALVVAVGLYAWAGAGGAAAAR